MDPNNPSGGQGGGMPAPDPVVPPAGSGDAGTGSGTPAWTPPSPTPADVPGSTGPVSTPEPAPVETPPPAAPLTEQPTGGENPVGGTGMGGGV